MLRTDHIVCESMQYDQFGDYPIQDLLEWLYADNTEVFRVDTDSLFRDLDELYIKLNDQCIQSVLRTMNEIKEELPSRRKFLNASEVSDLKSEMVSMFEAFEKANDYLDEDPDLNTIREALKRGIIMSSQFSDRLASYVRGCRFWVQDHRRDNEEVAYYQDRILSCLDKFEDAYESRIFGSDAHLFLEPDIDFDLNEDSSLPKFLEMLKGRGKISTDAFLDMLEEMERVDGAFEASFDYAIHELKATIERLDSIINLQEIADELGEYWEKITDTIEGWPPFMRTLLRH